MDDAETALYVAAGHGHEAAVRLLIDLGADVNKVEDNGKTPLYIAAKNGNEAVV